MNQAPRFASPLFGLLLAFFAGLSVTAQAQEEQIVREIEIEYDGPKTIAEQRIRALLATKVGQPYSNESVEQDIRNLLGSGDVENARVLAQPLADGLKLIIVVSTRAGLGDIDFIGNSKFSNKRLLREVDLEVGDPVSELKLVEARDKIQQMYFNDGFPDVVIDYRVEQMDAEGLSRLVFTIDEGDKTIVDEIRFNGNTVFSDGELRDVMQTSERGLLSFITRSGVIDNAELENDIDRIEEAYQNAGYLKAEVTEFERVRVSRKKVDLEVTIFEGEKFDVAAIEFTGMQVFTEEEIRPALTLLAGDAYSAAKLSADVGLIQDYYGSRGYADVRVDPVIRDAGPQLLRIIYEISEGGVSYVGKVNIEGNTKTKDKVLRREVSLLPGDILNAVELRTSKNRLENLDYFSEVEVFPSATGATNYKDINVIVNEKNTGKVSFQVALNSIESIFGDVSVSQTNFDITNWPSFTGGGQRFDAALRYGTERRDFSIGLTEPWFLGQKLSVGGEAYFRDKFFLSDRFDQREIGVNFTVRKPIDGFSFVSATYTVQQISLDDFDSSASPELRAEEGDFFQNRLGLNYVRDSRDDLLTPRRGSRVQLGTEVSGLGDVETYGFSAEAIKFYNLRWDTILSLQGDLRIKDGWGDDPPIFERLFLGGQRTMRGFDFRDVGPKDSTGEPLGGGTALFASAEYTFPIIQAVRGAVFYDVGFVNTDSYDFDTGDYNSNYGIGLRLQLPFFGPVSLNYGIPIEADEFNDSDGRFSFAFGF
ncbi:MAG: outer membrane protein assembly factor BamA [Verrucomicrobiota bacterium]